VAPPVYQCRRTAPPGRTNIVHPDAEQPATHGCATNGGYRLLGINVTGTNYTRGCTVVVDPAPGGDQHVITAVAYQTSMQAPPTHSSHLGHVLLGASLIAGQNPPTLGYGTGNFNDPDVGYPNTAGGLPVSDRWQLRHFAYDGSHPAFCHVRHSHFERWPVM